MDELKIEPGVESMLGHAPAPLTAKGLDMRAGHPAKADEPFSREDSSLDAVL